MFLTLTSGRELLLGINDPARCSASSPHSTAARVASAVAGEPSVVHQMSGEQFLDRLGHEPEIAVAMLHSLVEQLRRANTRLRARNTESAFVRTGHVLIEMASLALRHGPDPDRIELNLTPDEIADWTGATRESTARALGRLRRSGVVRTGSGRLFIDDLPGLVEVVETG